MKFADKASLDSTARIRCIKNCELALIERLKWISSSARKQIPR